MRNFSQFHDSSNIIQYYSCNDEYCKTIQSEEEICDNIAILFERFEEQFNSLARQAVLLILDEMKHQYEQSPKKFRSLRYIEHNTRMWEICNDANLVILSASEMDAMFGAIMFCLPLWLDKYDVPSASYAFTYANLNTGTSLVMIYANS